MLRRRIVHPFLVQIVLRTAMPRYLKNSWVSVVSYSFFTVLTLYFYIYKKFHNTFQKRGTTMTLLQLSYYVYECYAANSNKCSARFGK